MKTIWDSATTAELKQRISMLSAQRTAVWGKMNVYQMIQHCIQWEEMMTGQRVYKQSFIGKLFGKMALKGMLKEGAPVKRNMPTVPDFVIKEQNGDVEAAKARWLELVAGHAHYSQDGFMHPFFGFTTREQTGYLAYKHADHHLKQFNC